ncbi:hypothetical protein [Thermomonospora sp. CIF 1]|uniref:hypothetical protein n=1 Tax=Thermomonospora sp. CIF 1 TaxID=1916083 RepID=UPI000CA67E34|nr:hypothetical protein [Thermomonospora sp. CIF 1]PKK16123.1 MAG: hypothetical protein BUE48_001350 [Thermomonospora sp. CIF 1]
MSVPESSFDALLARAKEIDGLEFGCVLDAATGMVLGTVRADKARESGGADGRIPVAAAGAADVAGAVSLMAGALAADEGLEDVIITLTGHYHLIRRFDPTPRLQFLLLVVLDRARANLAMALRQLRDLHVDPPPVPEPAGGRHREAPGPGEGDGVLS